MGFGLGLCSLQGLPEARSPRLTHCPFPLQAAEAGAGATGAEEAEEGLGAEVWAGAAEAGVGAREAITRRTRRTSTRMRWR